MKSNGGACWAGDARKRAQSARCSWGFICVACLSVLDAAYGNAIGLTAVSYHPLIRRIVLIIGAGFNRCDGVKRLWFAAVGFIGESGDATFLEKSSQKTFEWVGSIRFGGLLNVSNHNAIALFVGMPLKRL